MRESRRLSRTRIFTGALAAWALSLPPSLAQALQWSVTPSASVTETWSDNVDLEPDDQAESGFLTTLSPGVAGSVTGNRLQASLAYRLNAVFDHRDEGTDELFHNLNARADSELVERLLFVDASARARQNLSNLGDSGGSSLTSGNDNLTQNYGATVSPRLENRLGRFARSTLRYSHERVWFDGASGDERVHRGEWRLVSGHVFRRIGWSLQASYQDIKSTDDGDDELLSGTDGTLTSASGTLRYALTPRLELNGTGGYEDNDLGETGGDLSGEDTEAPFWDVGLRWRPNRRLDVEVGGGERFFGRSLRARVDYQRRRLSANLSYTETLQDNRSVVLGDQAVVPVFSPDCPVGVEGCEPVGERTVFLVDTVDGFFVARRLQSSVALSLRRHTFSVSAFRLTREFDVGSQDERQLGASADWVWSLGPDTQLRVGARYTREHFDEDDRDDDLWEGDVAISRQVGEYLNLQASYSHQRQDSDQPASEFTENAVVVSAGLSY